MLLLLLLQVATAPPPPPPPLDARICAPVAPDKPRLVIDRDYVVVGQSPGSGKVYSGKLQVTRYGTDYQLVRTIDNVSVTGRGTPVACGPDKVQLLEVRYPTTPATEFQCIMTVNYDNYSVASCGPASNSGRRTTGLEAWYPQGEP